MNQPIHVLFVEDVEDDSFLLLRELRKGGYEPTWVRVETASDLRSALREQTWDVVLSDYSLPGFSGPEALKIVQELAPDVPFILISGTVGEEIAVESIKAGAADYLMKGSLIRLVSAVRRAVLEADARKSARLASDALHHSQQLLSLIYHNVSDALLLLARDYRGEFRCVSFNTTFLEDLRIAGHNLNERDLIGRTVLELDQVLGVDFDLAAAAESHRQRAGTARGPVTSERIIHAPKGELVFEVTYTPLVDSRGECTHLLAAMRDVTAKKLADKRERDLREQLAHSQKMEALGRLAGGVAHDFNNLLACILGFAELAVDSPADAPQYLEEVLTAGRRAAELVRQILAFGRRTAPERRPVSLHAVIEEVKVQIRAGLPANIKSEFQYRSGVAVRGDAGQLHQVVMNLCRNAVHAMPNGGEFQVRLDLVTIDEAQAAKVPGLKPGRYAMIEVRDTGIGMSSAVRARIFEPFFTTKPTGQGTGLGLAVVHGIVQDHEGAIEVDTLPGQGSVFRVYIPETIELVSEDQRAVARRGCGQRILVLDDEPAVASATAGLLTASGYQTDVFTDPIQACQAFETTPNRWSAIVTDLAMPVLTGRQVVERVRQVSREFPIVLTTGFIPPHEVAEWEAMSNVIVIGKPFRTTDLTAALAALVIDEIS